MPGSAPEVVLVLKVRAGFMVIVTECAGRSLPMSTHPHEHPQPGCMERKDTTADSFVEALQKMANKTDGSDTIASSRGAARRGESTASVGRELCPPSESSGAVL